MKASSEDYAETLRAFFEHGANIKAPHSYQMSAIRVASEQGHTEIVQLLLDPVDDNGDVHQAASNEETNFPGNHDHGEQGAPSMEQMKNESLRPRKRLKTLDWLSS